MGQRFTPVVLVKFADVVETGKRFYLYKIGTLPPVLRTMNTFTAASEWCNTHIEEGRPARMASILSEAEQTVVTGMETWSSTSSALLGAVADTSTAGTWKWVNGESLHVAGTAPPGVFANFATGQPGNGGHLRLTNGGKWESVDAAGQVDGILYILCEARSADDAAVAEYRLTENNILVSLPQRNKRLELLGETKTVLCEAGSTTTLNRYAVAMPRSSSINAVFNEPLQSSEASLGRSLSSTDGLTFSVWVKFESDFGTVGSRVARIIESHDNMHIQMKCSVSSSCFPVVPDEVLFGPGIIIDTYDDGGMGGGIRANQWTFLVVRIDAFNNIVRFDDLTGTTAVSLGTLTINGIIPSLPVNLPTRVSLFSPSYDAQAATYALEDAFHGSFTDVSIYTVPLFDTELNLRKGTACVAVTSPPETPSLTLSITPVCQNTSLNSTESAQTFTVVQKKYNAESLFRSVLAEYVKVAPESISIIKFTFPAPHTVTFEFNGPSAQRATLELAEKCLTELQALLGFESIFAATRVTETSEENDALRWIIPIVVIASLICITLLIAAICVLYKRHRTKAQATELAQQQKRLNRKMLRDLEETKLSANGDQRSLSPPHQFFPGDLHLHGGRDADSDEETGAVFMPDLMQRQNSDNMYLRNLNGCYGDDFDINPSGDTSGARRPEPNLNGMLPSNSDEELLRGLTH